jgi:sulfide dehydrogenase cytochrome subunit
MSASLTIRISLPLLLLFCCGPGQAGSANADIYSQNCTGCHGSDGISVSPDVPTIAGLNFRYFFSTMLGFKQDKRKATVMNRIAKGYRMGKMQKMALYYGTKPWTPAGQSVDPELAQRGAELHREYCEKCHKDNGRYQDKETPPLAGQSKGYLLLQMRDYRVAATVMPQPPLMQERLEKLQDADLVALGEYYASGLPFESSADRTADEGTSAIERL